MKQFRKILITFVLAVSMITASFTVISRPTTTAQAATIKISNKTLSLSVDDTKTLTITGTTKKVTWTSDNKTVATVSSKGKVTAKSAGEATITATVNKKVLTCKVTVVDAVSSATKKKR